MPQQLNAFNDRNKQMRAFLDNSSWADAHFEMIAGDASFRKYYRLTDKANADKTAILMDAPPPMEDIKPFITVGEYLLKLGLSAPKMYERDTENGFLILEDFGGDTFTRLLEKNHDEYSLYKLATETLIALHKSSSDMMQILQEIPDYNENKLLEEALLLPDWYMPAVLNKDTNESLRAEYCQIWKTLFPLLNKTQQTLVLRDYHVDNLMVLKGREGFRACGLLDFQDAVKGSVVYDFMSLLEDARRDINPNIIKDMKEYYLQHFSKTDRRDFEAAWAILAAQRHAKVIGIFTRLCIRDKKPIYLNHIPRVWRLLEQALQHPALSEMKVWIDKIIPQQSRIIPQQDNNIKAN